MVFATSRTCASGFQQEKLKGMRSVGRTGKGSLLYLCHRQEEVVTNSTDIYREYHEVAFDGEKKR